MDFTPRRQPSFSHRFADRAVKFPGLRIFWWICTLGYKFPRIRKGENLGFCIAKNFVIFFVRLSCILGAIWYLGSWFAYVSQGNQRPFNMSERQVSQIYGTTVPILNLFSTAVNQIQIEDVLYRDWNSSSPLNFQVINSTTANLPGQEIFSVQFAMDVLVTSSFLGSVQVVLKHSLPLTTFGWTMAGLLHPLKQNTQFTPYDMTNQYFFLPGHYVEIHYTPLQFSQVYQPDSTTSLFRRFQVFMGYGGEVMDYSYQSTAMVTPFLPGSFDNATTIIIIRPASSVEILTTADEKVTFRDTMSNIGGLIGIVGSVIVFLFGASLMSPWGFVAGVPYFRNRICRSMAEAYDTENGLSKGPFTLDQNEIGTFDGDIVTPDQKMTLLKERIDELELVLSEYYLNGDVFSTYAHNREQLKSARQPSSAPQVPPGKTSLNPSMEGLSLYELKQQQQQQYQQQYQQQRPSQTLMESQHQHKGPLPSPKTPPSHSRRQSSEQQRQDASEPSASTYHRQLMQDQLGKGRRTSQQPLMRSMSEDDAISPTHTVEQDLQMQGLLQRDHHLWHQSQLQEQQQQQQQQQRQQPPVFPPRPKDSVIPLTVNTTTTFPASGSSASSLRGGQSAGAEAGRDQIEHVDLTNMQREF
ncbi:hypothetical protein EDD21DRAFT_408472 [Dissophora ornata]|nr:hypothetical protein EDD21DRAFT_408472 [Dissophora ornata]